MEKPQHFFMKLYGSFYSWKEVESLSVRERQRQGDEYRLLYWPITTSLDYLSHAVPSSRPHLVLLQLLSRGVLNLWAALYDAARARPQTETDSRLTLVDCSHLMWDVHISFYNTHAFPVNHVTASDYFFHWCVLCRESMIDDLVKGQYVTS